MQNEKANILVMGNSGSGKSTLINAVLDNKVAKTSLGDRGTSKMDIYESEAVPFRLIDSKGMEYGLLAQFDTKRQIEKWTKENLTVENKEKCINMIWFCVDAMSARLFKESIKMLKSVTKHWKSVPVIVVITKSYSEVMRLENEQMVREQLNKYVGNKVNICDIISVVAEEMPIDNNNIVAPYGIDDLIDSTTNWSPKALQMTDVAIQGYKRRLKKKEANAITATATTASAIVGAVPIPFADAMILVPLQTGMVQAIAKVYGISNEDKMVVTTIVECGTVSAVARTALSGLKTVIPGAGSILNSVIASVFTAAVGEIDRKSHV